jgi:hypothetical protein
MKLPLAYISSRSTPNGGLDRMDTVRIVSWTALVITVIVFGARQIMKVIVFRTVTIDDLFIFLAFVSYSTPFLLSCINSCSHSVSASQQQLSFYHSRASALPAL